MEDKQEDKPSGTQITNDEMRGLLGIKEQGLNKVEECLEVKGNPCNWIGIRNNVSFVGSLDIHRTNAGEN